MMRRDGEQRRGVTMLLRRSVPYARRVALTGAERFRTWICRALRERWDERKEKLGCVRRAERSRGGSVWRRRRLVVGVFGDVK